MKLTLSVQEFNKIASFALVKNGLDKDLVKLKVYMEDDKLVGITTSKFFINNFIGLFSSDQYIKCRVERIVNNDVHLRLCNTMRWTAKHFSALSSIVSVKDDIVILHLENLEMLKPYLPMVTIESISFPGETVEVKCALVISSLR